jgi:hypothetical protein
MHVLPHERGEGQTMTTYQRFVAEDGRSVDIGLGIIGDIVGYLPLLIWRLESEQAEFETWECQDIAGTLADILATNKDDDDQAAELEHLVRFFRRSGQTVMIRILT